jgi:hypothetical protein
MTVDGQLFLFCNKNELFDNPVMLIPAGYI